MEIAIITALMFLSMFLLLVLGVPIVFTLASVGTLAALIFWSPQATDLLYSSFIHLTTNVILIAIPLFLFMGIVLEKSGIADALFEMIYRWAGGVRGGLAVGTVFVCVIIAAMVGVAGAGTVAMGIIALPALLKRGYNKLMVSGVIQAGGALGFLIPPSVAVILYALITEVSIGKLFAAGIVPGLLLATMYIIYILVRCYFQPELGPALPPEDRATWRQKFNSLRGIILPAILIFLVLGLMILGIASPTESAAIGSFGAILCAAIHKRATPKFLFGTALQTMKLSGMIMWIAVAALFFSKVYSGLGASSLIESLIIGLQVNRWVIVAIMQVSLFFLGMVMDEVGILYITAPIYYPIIIGLGFDPVWFGILYILNMQTGFLTPPFGLCLFYLKGVAPPEITMGDLYKSVWPFVSLQVIMLVLCMAFPAIVLWLPNLIWGV